MKKFKIIIEEHVSEEFEVEAENIEEAFNIVEKKYYSGEFVLEPNLCLEKQLTEKKVQNRLNFKLYKIFGVWNETI